MPYLNVTKGSWDKVGSTFTVKDNAEAPFTSLAGKSVVNIAMMPVQQGPWVYNTKALSKDDQKKIASHQGSAVNLLKGDADVAAFDDADLMPYLNVTKGSWDKVGSTFTVKDNAEAPFTSLAGKS
ncbi:hypothetical protein WP50_27315 [Lactiplantibacillus plantarum]|nr:hypothetical protein WP50_27315 [Lactiplantibacillus plantarum]